VLLSGRFASYLLEIADLAVQARAPCPEKLHGTKADAVDIPHSSRRALKPIAASVPGFPESTDRKLPSLVSLTGQTFILTWEAPSKGQEKEKVEWHSSGGGRRARAPERGAVSGRERCFVPWRANFRVDRLQGQSIY